MKDLFTMMPNACLTDVHWFCAMGEWLLLDVNSGNIFEIDETAARALEALARAQGNWSQAASQLTGEELAILTELAELTQAGDLFCPDEFEGKYIPPQPVLKSFCLNISHDCNLRCRYCFAGTGAFGGARLNMPLEVAKGAIDYVLAHSGKRKFLEVDFFGGEPMMNWDVVQQTVEYARSREAAAGKTIRFTITTNALDLPEEKTKWLLEHDVSVVLSHDGRKEIHDGMRVKPGGKPSHDEITANISRHIAADPSQNYYVRGTYSARNLDFTKDIQHWLDLGWRRLSMEPVVDKDAPWRLTEEHLPRIRQEYETLAQLYEAQQQKGDAMDFFHFNVDVEHGPCLPKRLTGCGAGYEYMVVTPEGDLYPCHQFVGREGYRLGSISEGVTNQDLVEQFRNTHVYSKKPCSTCWARFHCSGGCHANAQLFHGDISQPYEMGCALAKIRTELALALAIRRLRRQRAAAESAEA